MEQQLELKYKGERTYLHGTDIFNETLAWLGSIKSEIKDIDFAFHRLGIRQLKAVLGEPAEGVVPAAVCTFNSSGVRERVHLVETDQEIAGRYPYPEDEIVASMAVDLANRVGTLHGKMEYSDIEVWVAMTKALHYKVFPQLQGKWLFVRGRFPQYARQTEAAERVLRIASSFNDKLTRSEALLDGAKVGEIYFSIV